MGSNLVFSQFSLTIFIHFTFDFPIDNNGYSWYKALLPCMFIIFLLNVLQWIHENFFDKEGRFFWCFPSEGERFNGCLRGFSFIRCKTGVSILWAIYQLHWFCIGDINLSVTWVLYRGFKFIRVRHARYDLSVRSLSMFNQKSMSEIVAKGSSDTTLKAKLKEKKGKKQ